MSTTTATTGLTTGTWTIDPSHSEASFTVRHAGISKVRGTVAITEGAVVVGEDGTATVTATLDPATVSTGDATRDGHLTTADFFEVETYPTWTFSSSAVQVSDEADVPGELTIHGVTQPVTLAVEFNGAAKDAYGNQRAGFTGTTTISRKEFGLTWNAALEAGGVLVSDKVQITLEVSTIAQA
ncbi:MAG: YceI family protein [Actinomycetales bacterium]|nr:YceI family protein [Actinomycetales bacterium]